MLHPQQNLDGQLAKKVANPFSLKDTFKIEYWYEAIHILRQAIFAILDTPIPLVILQYDPNTPLPLKYYVTCQTPGAVNQKKLNL